MGWIVTEEDRAHIRYLQNLDQFAPQPVYVWPSQGLWNAQRGGLDPSKVYISVDRYDALEQIGFDELNNTLFEFSPPDMEISF